MRRSGIGWRSPTSGPAGRSGDDGSAAARDRRQRAVGRRPARADSRRQLRGARNHGTRIEAALVRLGCGVRVGPNAPIPHLAKARVLGRLSVYFQDSDWLREERRPRPSSAGWRRYGFHSTSRRGTLISLLSASSFLVPSLHSLANEVSRLNPDSRARIEIGLRTLPATGFDWPSAIRAEESALVAGVRLNAVPNLRTEDLGALRATVAQIADALSLPPDRARTALANVNLGSFPLPSPARINDRRETIRAARQRVVDALAR